MRRDRRKNWRGWPLVVLGLAAIGLLFAPTAFSAEKITWRLDWVPGPEHSAVYWALDKGLFKAEGLDVEIQNGQGSNVSVKLAGNKTNDFAQCSSDVTLIGRTKGLKVKTVSQLYQKSPAGIMSLASNPIKTPADLKGKKLGIDPKSTVQQQLIAALTLNKFDRSSYEEIPVGKAIMQVLVAKKVDAAISYNYIQPILLGAQGHKVNNIIFADWGLKVYSMGIITHEDTIAKNPKLVRAGIRAITKAWYETKRNPKAVLDHFLKTQKPKAEASYVTYAENSLPNVLSLFETSDTEKHGFGWSNKDTWEAMQKTLKSLNLIETTVNVDEVFTNQFVPGKL